jgi:hypothetical protein
MERRPGSATTTSARGGIDQRLVVETALAGSRVIETYERSGTPTQLTVTTTVDLGGQVVSVRRVYDGDGKRCASRSRERGRWNDAAEDL